MRGELVMDWFVYSVPEYLLWALLGIYFFPLLLLATS